MPPDDEVAVAIAVGRCAEIGRVRGHHAVVQLLGMDEVRVGMMMAKVRQGRAVHHRALRRAEPLFENLDRIGTSHRAHRIEGEGESVRNLRADRGEIEQAFHQVGIGGDGIDHIDSHAAQRGRADRVEINVGGVEDLVAFYRQGALDDRVGHFFRRRAAIADIIFDAEIFVRAAGIVAGRQDETAKGARCADEVRGGGRGQYAALAHQHPAKAIGRRHLQHDLDDFAVEVAPVAADDQGLPRKSVEAVEHRLDEIFGIMGLREDAYLLAQARRAGLLVREGLGRNGLDHAGIPLVSVLVSMARLDGPFQSSMFNAFVQTR